MGNSKPSIGFYDRPMWDGFAQRQWKMQRCTHCGKWRYPPAPICDACSSLDYEWKPISGRGTIMSWVVYHRQYFDDYPPPYNCVAVKTEEGPILVSGLVGDSPKGSWIGCPVEIVFESYRDGLLPKVKLATS